MPKNGQGKATGGSRLTSPKGVSKPTHSPPSKAPVTLSPMLGKGSKATSPKSSSLTTTHALPKQPSTGLSPMPGSTPKAKKQGAERSTRGRYLQAGKRDAERLQSDKVGSSRHKFELKARQARIDRKAQSKQTVQTPYGPVNLSPFPTKDPAAKITTIKDNYKGSSVGHKYSEIVDELIPSSLSGTKKRAREQDVADELLEAISNDKRPTKKRKIEDGAQSNAAAKFLAISHISEPDRVGGSSKDFRRVLRKVKRGGTTFHDAFVGSKQSPPEYGMAKNPNTTRRALGIGRWKNPHEPSHFSSRDTDYSDSSDDETD